VGEQHCLAGLLSASWPPSPGVACLLVQEIMDVEQIQEVIKGMELTPENVELVR